MDSPADELFYGGGGGGGKTDLAIGLSLTQHTKSLFLRREAAQLITVVERLRTVLDGRGRFASSGHGGFLRLDGRTLELAGCEHDKDKLAYKGRDHDLKIFDEASEFTKGQYQFIVGWNRTADPKQRCRVLCASNPPTSPEGRWIVEEWAPWLDGTHHDPALPGELRWYTTLDGETAWFKDGEPFTHKGEKVFPRSRTFIPALLADNPIYEATGYRAVLQALPEPWRSQVLFGDMNAGTEDDAYQVIPTRWIRLAQERWTEEPPDLPLTCLGVDAARGGKDKMVISPRRGWWFGRLVKVPGKEVPDGESASNWILGCHEDEADINIDMTGGFGSSPYDILRGLECPVRAVVFSERTNWRDRTRKLHFANVRAAMYWCLRDALDPEHGDGLALPPDPELVADLCAPRYIPRASGILVEAKEDIVKRIGRSPDCGDALVLALWHAAGKRAWVA